METHREKLDRISIEAQDDMKMGGLAGTMYQEYAEKVLYRYLKEITKDVFD